ncbi:GTP-binding protein [Alloactinosynnema sp. L-07]|uniref:CobW family GTP-binding protein n=1 Tax=Alloactinosynnema sp. L-07 TaxID=1653480 RepID=UPI0006B4828E|nr:GTP-binding protein [Alloactinosynnema sp. L-07]
MTIPVVVVAGFLGSGKTTMLNHLLTSRTGTRIGVIVNDFGRVNIDAMTVAAQVDSMVTLGNGCLCCVVDVSDLDAMLDRLATPDAPVDVIVIEASGLAEPPAMVRLVMGSTNPRVTYGGLVEVVDAAEFTATRLRHPQLDKHLRYADLVLLNKMDRAQPGVLALVRELAEGVPVMPIEHGRVDPALLFEPVDRPDPAWRQLSFDDLADHEPHIHAAYETTTFTSGQPLNPTRFARFLTERPDGLYRMKGYVHFGDTERYSVQTVGTYISVRPESESHDTRLVMIGAGLDLELITKTLADAVESDPASVDPLDLLSVTRYVRD